MFELKNKVILILSPQAWGKMFVSKHHYAYELAMRGNDVFFLNPPGKGIDVKNTIEITPLDAHPNLNLIQHQLFFPYQLKFKALPLFHWLMKFHLRKVLKKIGKPVDIVWSFDLGNLYPLSVFGKRTYKIFHPVDEPLNKEAINAAKGADIIFAVTNEILQKYHDYDVPKHFINHGVLKEFIADNKEYVLNNPPQVGYSGNLLRPEIDWNTLLRIVNENPLVIFNFWGTIFPNDSNLGGSTNTIAEFIQNLKSKRNVKLHGVIPAKELATAIRLMDAFLICYDVQKDQSGGTNYHKVLEYMATGRVIISNNITTYRKLPNLVRMIEERDSNQRLSVLFGEVIKDLQNNNSRSNIDARLQFAQSNTYEKQLERIQSHILNDGSILVEESHNK